MSDTYSSKSKKINKETQIFEKRIIQGYPNYGKNMTYIFYSFMLTTIYEFYIYCVNVA